MSNFPFLVLDPEIEDWDPEHILLVGSLPSEYLWMSPSIEEVYPNYDSAIVDAEENTLILVGPGIYDVGVTVHNKRLIICGLGEGPEDTLVRAQDNNLSFQDGANVFIENMTYVENSTVSWRILRFQYTDGFVFANKSRFTVNLTEGSHALWFNPNTDSRPATFRNCYFLPGYNVFARADQNVIRLEDCVSANIDGNFCWQCSGSWDYYDVATTDGGYRGPEYGSFLLNFLEIPGLENIQVTSGGLVRWDPFPDADEYRIRVNDEDFVNLGNSTEYLDTGGELFDKRTYIIEAYEDSVMIAYSEFGPYIKGTVQKAVGGTDTYLSEIEGEEYLIHEFNDSRFLDVLQEIDDLEYFIVASGASGGRNSTDNNRGGGGGGGGGIKDNIGDPIIVPVGSYLCLIGNPGIPAPLTGNRGTSGENSSFFDIVADGGGAGGGASGNVDGLSGGSGGGGGNFSGTGAPGISGQGYAGADQAGDSLGGGSGGGGGGAGGDAPEGDQWAYNPGGPGRFVDFDGLGEIEYSRGGEGGHGFNNDDRTGDIYGYGWGGNGTRYATAGTGGFGRILIRYRSIPVDAELDVVLETSIGSPLGYGLSTPRAEVYLPTSLGSPVLNIYAVPILETLVKIPTSLGSTVGEIETRTIQDIYMPKNFSTTKIKGESAQANWEIDG